MPIDITMPALSPTMETGTLAKWLVKPGDAVKSGDILAEIETDKATMEVESIDEGTVAELLVADGAEDIKVGAVIARLTADGETAATPVQEGDPPPQQAGQGGHPKAGGETAPPPEVKGYGAQPAADAELAAEEVTAPEPTANGHAAPAAAPGGRVVASPLAKRLAAAKGLDLSALTGSGPHGRIVKADVDGAGVQSTMRAAGPQPGVADPAREAPAAKAPPAPVPAPADAPYETVKLNNIRKVTARRLAESKATVPHFYLTVDILLDPLLAARAQINTGLAAAGIKVSVNDLLIKALGVALERQGDSNVSFAGDSLIKYTRADVSVAVAISGGLITPIIRDAANKRVSVIAAEMKDLAARAKDGKLKPEEFTGGTASLSNLGMFGIKQFDAVINPPQGLILAVGAGEQRPVATAGALSVATVMTATGSFDHRAIDGATGAQFMAAFKALVEQPLSMLA